ADHALGSRLGIGLRRGPAGAVFEIRRVGGVPAAEPGLRADRKQRQRLRQIVDRAERIERTSAGDPDLVDPGRYRRRELVAPSGTGIALPFVTGRNHQRPPRGRSAAKFVSSLSVSPRLGRVLNTATHKMFQVLENSRNISRGPIRGHGEVRPSTADCKETLQFSDLVVLRRARAVKSRHRDRRGATDALAARSTREDNRSLPTIIKPE